MSTTGIHIDAEVPWQASEDRFRAMIQAVPSLTFEGDPEGNNTFVSDQWCVYTGLTPEESAGWGWSQALHPDEAEGVKARWSEALRTGSLFENKNRLRGADGVFRWFIARILPVSDAQGDIVRWVGSLTNIDELVRTEQALRASEEFSRRLLASSHDCIKVLDLDLNLLSMNEGGRRLMEVEDVDRYLNKPFVDFFREEERPKILEAMKVALAGGVGRVEVYCPTVSGKPRWWEDQITPIRGADGRPERLLVVAREITERKQMEDELAAAKLSAERAMARAEEASRAKDHFLAVLSHELRTPLMPVLATASMLAQDWRIDVEIRQGLEVIRRNAELEARLIDDLLDVTRIARGKIELDKRPIPIGEVILRAVEVCEPDIQARGLHFSMEMETGAPCWIEADTARLQQVFWNLLKNAIKFTPPGGCVGLRCRAEGGRQVIVEVSDSGEGIEPEAVGRVFNAFEQAERSITRQFGGLGLGLTISKALVEMHGGAIEAQSAGKGKGATFRVRLPLVRTPARPPAAPVGAAPGGAERPARPLNVLLVEDHGDTARVLSLLLKRRGYQVRTAGDVATAIEQAVQQNFDLLISDLGLPDRSGVELIRELRARGQTLPAIALSGYGQEEDVTRSRAAGFNAHLTKPVDFEQFYRIIADVAG